MQSLTKSIQAILTGQATLEQNLDPRLNQVLHAHGLAARAFRVLEKQAAEVNESLGLMQDLKKAYLHSVQSTQTFMQLAHQLKNHFEIKKIAMAFIKGPILAQRIYAHPYDRTFCDLDLYFPTASFESIKNEMESLGFIYKNDYSRFFANDAKAEFFFGGNPKICVECHFQLGYEQFLVKPQIIHVDSWPVLDPISEYAFLVFHAGVQHRFQKFVWLLDLWLFRAQHPDLNLSQLPPDFQRVIDLVEQLFDHLFRKNIHDSSVQIPARIPRWIQGLVDESELTKWDVAKLRWRIQGASTFVKYAVSRCLTLSKDRLRAGH